MGLEKVVEEIARAGEEEMRAGQLEAERQADELVKAAERAMGELAERKAREVGDAILQMRVQARSNVELEVKKLRMTAQKEVMDSTYAECLAALEILPRNKMLASVVDVAMMEMPDAYYVYSTKEDEKAAKKLSGLKHAGIIECRGGVVVEDKERTVRLDCTYESLAAEVWSKNLKEMAKTLFG